MKSQKLLVMICAFAAVIGVFALVNAKEKPIEYSREELAELFEKYPVSLLCKEFDEKKVILSTIFQYSWINALWYYIIYIIYLSIGYCIMGNRMEYIPRNTFDGIFGEGFSAASPYLYYMVQGIPSILIGTFVYTLFGCVIALYCKKSYQALLWMLGYFWGTQILLEFFRCTFLKQQAGLAWFIGKFEPTFLYGFYGYVYHNPTIRTALQTMDSLILPVLLSCGLLIIFFRKEEKINA